MNIRILGWLVGFSAIASSFVSCTQAKVTCVVGHAGASPYAAQYFPTGATPACAATAFRPIPSLLWQAQDAAITAANKKKDPKDKPDPPPPPEALSTINGDQIGMESYHPSQSDADGVTPDFSKGNVALQADALGQVAGSRDPDAEPTDKLFASGDWKSAEPDATDFCSVPTIKSSVQKFPSVLDPKTMMCAAPAQDFTYEWKNLQVYVTAAATGTQFSADLTYTQVDHTACDATDAPTSCTIEYHVRGLWPAIACFVGDAAGNPQVDPATGKLKIDDTLCCPEADPDPSHGRPVGSGISPDFPTKCDVDLGLCVLDAPADAKLPLLGGNKTPACKTSTTK